MDEGAQWIPSQRRVAGTTVTHAVTQSIRTSCSGHTHTHIHKERRGVVFVADVWLCPFLCKRVVRRLRRTVTGIERVGVALLATVFSFGPRIVSFSSSTAILVTAGPFGPCFVFACCVSTITNWMTPLPIRSWRSAQLSSFLDPFTFDVRRMSTMTGIRPVEVAILVYFASFWILVSLSGVKSVNCDKDETPAGSILVAVICAGGEGCKKSLTRIKRTLPFLHSQKKFTHERYADSILKKSFRYQKELDCRK